MADQREVILARLAVLCASVNGITAVVRNALDVPDNKRPAVIIQDGAEALVNTPDSGRYGGYSEVQRMELSPEIAVFVRAGGAADAGALLSRYRSAIVAAVLSDVALRNATGTSGQIRYQGCAVAEPDAEAAEHRLDIAMTFQYVFRLGDL